MAWTVHPITRRSLSHDLVPTCHTVFVLITRVGVRLGLVYLECRLDHKTPKLKSYKISGHGLGKTEENIDSRPRASHLQLMSVSNCTTSS